MVDSVRSRKQEVCIIYNTTSTAVDNGTPTNHADATQKQNRLNKPYVFIDYSQNHQSALSNENRFTDYNVCAVKLSYA